MDDHLNSQLAKIMYNACRDEMIDSPVDDEIVAAQRTRLCYHRFYRLFNEVQRQLYESAWMEKHLGKNGAK